MPLAMKIASNSQINKIFRIFRRLASISVPSPAIIQLIGAVKAAAGIDVGYVLTHCVQCEVGGRGFVSKGGPGEVVL